MINATITLSIIISLCALISAPVTAAINNKHQQKMKELEIESSERQHKFDVMFENKLEAYKTFLKTAGAHHDLPTMSSERDILASANSAILLCEKKSSYDLESFLLNLPKDSKVFDSCLVNISELFNRELHELAEMGKNQK